MESVQKKNSSTYRTQRTAKLRVFEGIYILKSVSQHDGGGGGGFC